MDEDSEQCFEWVLYHLEDVLSFRAKMWLVPGFQAAHFCLFPESGSVLLVIQL